MLITINNLKIFSPVLNLIIIGLLLNYSQLSKANHDPQAIPLFEDLGSHHYPVSTKEPLAQRYFDQGLILAFSFNHAEAARSFKQAYQIDSKCALCYWGEALVLGPNINAPMDPAAVPVAYGLVQKMLAHAGTASNKEKILIQALSKRYTLVAPEDRTSLDEIYAASMLDAVQRFPDDAVIISLYAEALMDIHPWDFWSKQGIAKPWTAEIIFMLERALKIDENNPLANHLYIHMLEASPNPEKAIPSAERLPELVPGSGHLVHMPAHIYIRVGRYRDAILANQKAVKVDRGYLNHNHAESIYTMAYVPHNHHFLWAAAIKTGRKSLATQAAANTADQVNHELIHEPGFAGTLQHFYMIPLYTKALFGNWDAILAEPAPAAELVYPTGIWRYARGLALLRKGKLEAAKQELEMLKQNKADPAVAKLTVFDLNPVSQLLQIGIDVLQGEIAAQSNEYDTAVSYLEHAVELEDSLNYTEPKDWYLPPRQVLGAVLLASNKSEKAEQVYRQDLVYHPQNGWSLFGLLQSLRAQGKDGEADKVQKQFKQVWQDADVTLTGSRF